MPVTDALPYLHGSGSSAYGPVTSTAKSFTGSIATTGVLTITAGATGAALLVGDVITGAQIAINPCIVTSIIGVTAINGVGTYVVSAPQLSTSATILATPPLLGDLIGVGGAAQESNIELDFGVPSSGTGFPYLPEFPSYAEKGYTFPPEVVGAGGVEMGVHILITGPVTAGSGNTGGARCDVQSNSTTAATSVIASRTFTAAQLAVAGAHYYIPVSMPSVLEFLRFLWTNLATASTVNFGGSIIAWFGPRTGGEQ